MKNSYRASRRGGLKGKIYELEKNELYGSIRSMVFVVTFCIISIL